MLNQLLKNRYEKIVQTAGRDSLGDFAKEFAHFNDDVLFGENWNDELPSNEKEIHQSKMIFPNGKENKEY